MHEIIGMLGLFTYISRVSLLYVSSLLALTDNRIFIGKGSVVSFVLHYFVHQYYPCLFYVER